MESQLGDVRAKFAGRDDIVTLAVNADEDGTLAAPYLQDQKVEGTRSLPTAWTRPPRGIDSDGYCPRPRRQRLPTARKDMRRTVLRAPISDAITKASGAQ